MKFKTEISYFYTHRPIGCMEDYIPISGYIKSHDVYSIKEDNAVIVYEDDLIFQSKLAINYMANKKFKKERYL